MPIQTADDEVVAAYTRHYITIPCQNQILQALSIFDLYSASPQPEQYAILGIMVDGVGDGNRAAVLRSGYFGNDVAFGWTGAIITDPSMYLYAELYAYTGYTYRLAALIQQMPRIIPAGG